MSIDKDTIPAAPHSPWAEEPERDSEEYMSRTERHHSQEKHSKGSSIGRTFRSFLLTILLILLVFILAFSATFYARSRGWLKGKAPADPTVISNLFKAL
ncbi:MAG: hypothetical protein FWC48_04015 [Actinomycetia bacterium]|nr:hypothetical protein [Actinomycetes bacterium]